MFYRTDSTFAYVENAETIVGRMLDGNGNSWGDEFEVYNSSYDDRNLIVGTLTSGGIIIVFRKYDDTNLITVDTGFIKSIRR